MISFSVLDFSEDSSDLETLEDSDEDCFLDFLEDLLFLFFFFFLSTELSSESDEFVVSSSLVVS